ncbi:hypothetical protein GGH17_005494, partial [Coemansia sp. RSA 788]
MPYCLKKTPYFEDAHGIPVPTYNCDGDEWINLPINLSNKDQTYVFSKCAVEKKAEQCKCDSCKKAEDAKKQAAQCPCSVCAKSAEEAKKAAAKCPCEACVKAAQEAEKKCGCDTCKKATEAAK